MSHQRTSVGLDVHARSVVACGLDRETGEVVERRLTPDHREILDWLGGLPAPAKVTYEAGPTGFGLARSLAAAGIECDEDTQWMVPRTRRPRESPPRESGS